MCDVELEPLILNSSSMGALSKVFISYYTAVSNTNYPAYTTFQRTSHKPQCLLEWTKTDNVYIASILT